MISGHVWSGNFPQKNIYVREYNHKGVRRDSGGWVWVRMDAGGCISTQQTQNKANRDTDRSVVYIFDKGVWGEMI